MGGLESALSRRKGSRETQVTDGSYGRDYEIGYKDLI